mgnify:CR=1 FL=1
MAREWRFQSTLPVRGATETVQFAVCLRNISIHAPRAGSDEYAGSDLDKRMTISIHAPRAGSDFATPAICSHVQLISIHAPRAGSDNGTF